MTNENPKEDNLLKIATRSAVDYLDASMRDLSILLLILNTAENLDVVSQSLEGAQ